MCDINSLPTDIIGVIVSKLPFRQFMALLNANKKFRRLLAENEMWNGQVENLIASSKYRGQPNCQDIFRKIYENRKRLEPAKLEGFNSAFIFTSIAGESLTNPVPTFLGCKVNEIRHEDTLYIFQPKQSHNVNVVLSTHDSKPHFVRSLKVSVPPESRQGYVGTPPLSAGLIFLLNEEPDPTQLAKYDSFTKKQWDELTSEYDSVEELQAAGHPVVYFEGLEDEPEGILFVNFKAPCLVATYFVLKMLRASGTWGEGMHVGNFMLYGGLADDTFTALSWKDNDLIRVIDPNADYD